MHALRHFYASWCINRTEDGGLGLPPKNVQERLGHASITITLDCYGHPGELDEAAQALLG
jgi:integrase